MERRTRIQGWRTAAAALWLALALPAAVSAAYPGEDGRIHFSATGPSASAPDVWSIEPDGSALANLTDVPGGAGEGRDPSVSGVGTVAFVVGAGASAEIWAMGADGSAPRRLTDNAVRDEMPSISADGTRIVFVSDRGGDGDVWTMAGDGSGVEALYVAAGDDEYPQFSPDGEHVVLASHLSGDLDLALIPATGGPFTPATATQLTSRSELAETTPSVQPDQVRLAYSQYDPSLAAPQPRDILTAYSNDGTDEFPLATTAASETSPAFSPEGTRVVYVTGGGLVIAAAGGSNPAPLATGVASAPADPDWAPAPLAPDTTPPQTTITGAPDKRTAARRATFRFQSSEPGSSFECALDKRGFAACESPRRYRHLKRGGHRFRVRAIDAAGNVDATPDRARFKVLPRD